MKKEIFLITVLIFVSTFANAQFCKDYADKSVSQYNQAIEHNLPDIEWPVWSDDWQGHFDWCKKTDGKVVESELKKRQEYLNKYIKKNDTEYKIMSTEKITINNDITKVVKQMIPDLEVSAIKVETSRQEVVPYMGNCLRPKKLVYITNNGTKQSAPYILSIGYYKTTGNRVRYIEVERLAMPILLPGKQTFRSATLPQDADNIRAKIEYNNYNEGELNMENNTLEIKCERIK